MLQNPESLRQAIDRVFGHHSGGYIPSYLLRLVALSSMVGALAFEAVYRFGDIFGSLSLLLIAMSFLAFGCSTVFVALLVGYQVSAKSSSNVRRVHGRSW